MIARREHADAVEFAYVHIAAWDHPAAPPALDAVGLTTITSTALNRQRHE